MRIKQIEMTNYKSFKEKTTVSLHKNCNVVVGKNGSGKSNLITAIELIVCCPRIEPGERHNFIHEGSQEGCVIEIAFDNSSQRFHGPKTFSIRREVSPTRDDFFVDNKPTSREEIKGLFESAGIPVASPYFLVLQGRINSMAVMTEEQRHSLIKSVAGVSKYEEDRRRSLGLLEETQHTQTKVEGVLERITNKLESLEKDKEALRQCECLEKEKRRCEIGFMQMEIIDLNRSIREIDCPSVEEEAVEDSEEVEDIEYQIQETRREVEKIVKEKKSLIPEDSYKLKTTENKIEAISSQIKSLMERKEKVREAYEKTFVEHQALRMLREFLESRVGKGEGKCMEEEMKCMEEDREEENKCKEEINSSIKQHTTLLNFNLNSLKGLVEKRNKLWREEKKLKGDLKGVEDNFNAIGNKLMASGMNLHRDVKGEGVLGCVLDLFDVPEDLIPSFEAVAGGYLFHVVVEDETVASRLSLEGVTYIPLNRVFYKAPPSGVENEDLFLLSSKIQSKEKYRGLLSYITKNVFVSSDIKTANFYSQKHKVNVVTLDGDVFRNTGIITGGYESRKNVLVEYKRLRKEKEEVENKLIRLKKEIVETNLKIEQTNSLEHSEGSPIEFNKESSIDHRKILREFTKEKLNYFHSNKDTTPFSTTKRIQSLELKLGAIEGEEEALSSTLLNLKERLSKYNTLFLDLQSKTGEGQEEEERLLFLREKEKALLYRLKNKEIVKIEKMEDIEKEKERARRHLLYSKRLDLMKKIGVENLKEIDFVYPTLSKEDLTNKLKEIQHSLKKYVLINRRALHQWNEFLEQKENLKTRLHELKDNLLKIKGFIEDLDGKKERFLEFTFEMFRNNFRYFSKRLCSFGDLDIEKEGERLRVTNKGETVDLNILSGGQKTMVALCFIFSIQKIDPSPFYVFDEADANLDKQGREKITALFLETVQEEDVQFVISTFKEELVGSGNKFIGVSFSEKKSYAGEVTREVVSEFLNE